MPKRRSTGKNRSPAIAHELGADAPLEPAEVLVALSYCREPFDMLMSNMRRVHNPSKHDLAELLSALAQRGVLTPDRERLSTAGLALLKISVPEVLLESGTAIACYRAFAGSVLLNTPTDDANFAVLSDVKAVTAGAVVRLFTGTVNAASEKSKLTAQAVRLVVWDLLRRADVELNYSDTWEAKSIDPLVLDLFEAVTGSREPDKGLQKVVYGSFIKETDARWRKLTRTSFDSMIAKSRKPGKGPEEVLSSRVARALSSILSSRWVLISQAFEAYREIERVSLQDFKDALGVVAASEQIELSPIDVPHLYPADARQKSATTLGGLTFHLVRLRT